MLWIAPAIGFALYLLGVRFVGKPMAVYGWKFWTGRPYQKPTAWSYLLYPLVHSMHDGVPFSQERFLPWHIGPGDELPTNVPLVETWLYVAKYDSMSYYRVREWGEVDKRDYIHITSWWWLPRLVILAVLLHPIAVTRHLRAGLRWLVNGGLTKLVVGKTDK